MRSNNQPGHAMLGPEGHQRHASVRAGTPTVRREVIDARPKRLADMCDSATWRRPAATKR